MTISYFPFIQPDLCHRIPVRSTHRNLLGQHVLSTRKELEVFHEISFSFDKLSNRQARIIKNHNASMDGGVTSFYVVDWGEPKIVKAIDTKGYITLNNVMDLSVNDGDGGNRLCLWVNSGEYGNDSEVSGATVTDSSKAWTVNEWQNHKLMDTSGRVFNASSNNSNSILLANGANPHPGAYEIFRYENHTVSSINQASRIVTLSASIEMTYQQFNQFIMPVYQCHYAMDKLDGIAPTGEFNRESSDNYGPYYAGDVVFIQKGTG